MKKVNKCRRLWKARNPGDKLSFSNFKALQRALIEHALILLHVLPSSPSWDYWALKPATRCDGVKAPH